MQKSTPYNKSRVNDPSSTSFPCPNCGKVEIIRRSKCRKMGINYVCSKCKFEGP